MRRLPPILPWLAVPLVLLLAAAFAPLVAGAATPWTVVAWNNLGMHCMDADYGVFAILPPYNTIQAQVVDGNGKLVRDPAGLTVTYEAVADPAGSINTTSAGKSGFWDHALDLFHVTLAPDTGLTGVKMPGGKNRPQPMTWDAGLRWFIAEGIPITPTDDAGRKNAYPMMKVSVRNARGSVLASTRIVLPVSDEMDCSACHASGSVAAAKPSGGWANDKGVQRDFRRNVLRKHDDRTAATSGYAQLLASVGYDPRGLDATVVYGNKSVLCAACHSSEALPGSGKPGVPPLTRAVHAKHASVVDPTNGLPLDATANRSACYRCHPGSTTKCLRGAMGKATAADGSMLMQCQSCHGLMSAVGAATRTGWLNEPSCQGCHTGTATRNSGQIRYTSVFDASGNPRVAADATFATNADVPATGLSLYRFSSGHGGLQCSACHGSTHAEYPSSHVNDNVQSVALQGHAGMLVECSACHRSGVPSGNGPHGLHPIGSSWVSRHGDLAEHNTAACASCHGTDYRGTVLSRAQANRSFSTEHGTKSFAAGQQVGCYDCHNGPGGGGD